MWRVVAHTKGGKTVVLFQDEEERGARAECAAFRTIWRQRMERGDGQSQFVGLGGRVVKLWLIEEIEVDEV